MSTLKYFPNSSDQNCYTIPTNPKIVKYLIRVGFFYDNYDNLNNPPTFDLFIDGKKMVNGHHNVIGHNAVVPRGTLASYLMMTLTTEYGRLDRLHQFTTYSPPYQILTPK
ncbi:hypothetical protein COLO4_10875 [Corchorus olitorius]|uniref:Malectin-like domain-containing protein n=1 Tax=Corchorus olitorius TaxID=93759 RepID=A0A1R3K6P2_9ROSI|nr:hypothetical protein COLO4_10875 [Corchorus olitorius]